MPHTSENTIIGGKTSRAWRARQANSRSRIRVTGNAPWAFPPPVGMKTGKTRMANKTASATPTAPNHPSWRWPDTGEINMTRKAAIVVSAPKISIGTS